MLLTFPELQVELRRRIEDFANEVPDAPPGFLGGSTLEQSPLEEGAIDGLEQRLGRSLPAGIHSVLMSYELSGLELAGVLLGGESRDMIEYFERQLESTGSNLKLLQIGGSSGYTIWIDLSDGSVWAQERGRDQRVLVAADLPFFVRGLATLSVTTEIDDEQSYVRALVSELGDVDYEFWLALTSGAA